MLTVAVVVHLVMNRRRVAGLIAGWWRPYARPDARPAARLDAGPARGHRRAGPGRGAPARRGLARRRRQAGPRAPAASQPPSVPAAGRRRRSGRSRRPGPRAQRSPWPHRRGTVQPVRELPRAEHRERTAQGGRRGLGARGRRPRGIPAALRAHRLLCPAAHPGDARLSLCRGLECRARWLGGRARRGRADPGQAPGRRASSSPSTPTAAPTRTASPSPRRPRPRRSWPTRSTAPRCRRRAAGRCDS